jgi:hypothetical protein
MLKSEKGYKGVEYGITNLGDGKWKWVFYPNKKEGQSQHGEIVGTREQAEIACKKAIDAWRDSGDSTWSKITLPNTRDVHVKAFRLQGQFEGIFRTALAPEDAVMFQDRNIDQGCTFYFSPKATQIFSSFLRTQALTPTDCAAPERESVSLLVGRADAWNMLPEANNRGK